MLSKELEDRYIEIFDLINKENYFKSVTDIETLRYKLNDYKNFMGNNKSKRKVYILINNYLQELDSITK